MNNSATNVLALSHGFLSPIVNVNRQAGDRELGQDNIHVRSHTLRFEVAESTRASYVRTYVLARTRTHVVHGTST